jgi:hypothetical protein|nr:MAG TPA: replication protein [Caudoviricetes sp.]
MSYEKQVWENGKVITSEMLNHIEDGISTIDNVVATDTEKVKLIDQIKSDLEALKARVDALESKP